MPRQDIFGTLAGQENLPVCNIECFLDVQTAGSSVIINFLVFLYNVSLSICHSWLCVSACSVLTLVFTPYISGFLDVTEHRADKNMPKFLSRQSVGFFNTIFWIRSMGGPL